MGRLVGIAGGIGSGKSVVSRILRLKGYEVYDCDFRAKQLMESSVSIIDALRHRYGDDCLLRGGGLDRAYIAKRVFSADEERLWLNALVHGEVRRDVTEWAAEIPGLCFVESAILFSSGLAQMCEKVILVDASEETRLNRAMERGGISREDLLRRLESQKSEYAEADQFCPVHIYNDDNASLLSQIDDFLKEIVKI